MRASTHRDFTAYARIVLSLTRLHSSSLTRGRGARGVTSQQITRGDGKRSLASGSFSL